MALNHPVSLAMPSAAAKNNDGLRDALVERVAYALEAAADAQALDLTGVTVRALILDGVIFTYDSTDTTSPHDGVSTLVTADGKRFKTTDVAQPKSVLTRTGTPPGSPSIGDAHLVTVGTGDFAGQDDDIAVWLAPGWVFIAPIVGMTTLLVTGNVTWQYRSDGQWHEGLGGGGLGLAEVFPAHLFDGGFSRVENQTLTTPPGSPGEGVAYVPVATATGDWVGAEGKIAQYRGGAWEILTPADGWRIYDKALAGWYTRVDGSWVSDALSAGLLLSHAVHTLDDPLDINASNYTPSDTAPTTALGTPLLASGAALVINHTGTKIGNRLRITIDGSAENEAGGVNSLTLGLFIDAAVNASDWRSKYFAASAYGMLSMSFVVTLTDLVAHSYKLRGYDSGGNFEIKRATVTVEEIRQ